MSIRGIAILLLVLSFLGLSTANPELTFYCLAVVPVILLLLYRPGESQVLLFAVGIQWLEASMKVFHADILGKTVTDMSSILFINDAVFLSVTGVLVLAAGISLVLRFTKNRNPVLTRTTTVFSTHKLFLLYITMLLIFYPFQYVAYYIPRLTQPLLALTSLKFIVLYLLAVTIFQDKRNYPLLFLLTTITILVGFLDFFAVWKTPLFIVFLAYVTVTARIKFTQIATIALFMVIIFVLAVFWSSIKKEYRYVYGQLTTQQKIYYLKDELDRYDTSEFAKGIELLGERIAYVDFFALVLNRVPKIVPHENGKLWKEAVLNILKPRILFPDKQALVRDSVITYRYAGKFVSGARQETGSSIGIGYIAESYVDFGFNTMFIPVLMLGVLIGLIYRYFILKTNYYLIGYGITVIVMLNSAASIATSNSKVLGGLLIAFIIFALADKLGGRMLLQVTLKPEIIRQRRNSGFRKLSPVTR